MLTRDAMTSRRTIRRVANNVRQRALKIIVVRQVPMTRPSQIENKRGVCVRNDGLLKG